jgi:hypothetical protein
MTMRPPPPMSPGAAVVNVSQTSTAEMPPEVEKYAQALEEKVMAIARAGKRNFEVGLGMPTQNPELNAKIARRLYEKLSSQPGWQSVKIEPRDIRSDNVLNGVTGTDADWEAATKDWQWELQHPAGWKGHQPIGMKVSCSVGNQRIDGYPKPARAYDPKIDGELGTMDRLHNWLIDLRDRIFNR